MSTLVAQTLSNGTVSTSTANCIQGSAKAWVNFNGTTSPGTIRAQYNVSSVTKNGTGDYTVNFTNAFADTNYVALATTGRAQGGSAIIAFGPEGAVPATTSWRFSTISSGISGTDAATAYVAFFR
jgi:hypothetical protein